MRDIITSSLSLCPQTKRFLAPLPGVKPLELKCDLERFYLTSESLPRVLSRFPEHKHNSVPFTDISALIIASVWPEELITGDVHLLRMAVLKFIATTQAMQLQASCNRKEKPTHTFQSPCMPHQVYATKAALASKSYALFMEQGTGKTLVAITKMCEEALNASTYRSLVVCPGNVRTNWREEIERFAYVPFKIFTLHANELERIRMLLDIVIESRPSITICSYDVVWRMVETMQTIPWNTIVLDESHSIKSGKTKRTKGLLKLRDSAESRLLLTGTAIVNSPADLFSQLEFLEQGASGFSNLEAFKKFYCRYNDVGIYTGTQNVPFLQERLARYSFRVLKQDVLKDLPPKMYDVIDIEMTPYQREVYKKVSELIKIELEGMDDSVMTVNNALVKLMRLAQITSGFVKYDESTERLDPNPKLEELVKLLTGRPNKSIVWCCWTQDIKTITARLNIEGIKAAAYYGATECRSEVIDSFNKGDTQVLVSNPQCGGVGLNLLGSATQPCDMAVYYSQGWSPTVRSQSEDRSHRKGTIVPIRIVDLCVSGTIDEQIRKRVLKKRIEAFKLQDIRELLCQS